MFPTEPALVSRGQCFKTSLKTIFGMRPMIFPKNPDIQPDARESCETSYIESALSCNLSSAWILHDPTKCSKHSQK